MIKRIVIENFKSFKKVDLELGRLNLFIGTNARVTILTNPKLGGYDHAVAAIRNELALRYGHLDLWLFTPDADKAGELAALEREAEGKGVRLLCCAAKPEVEAWLLAGHREQLAIKWPEVVSHHQLKEAVFEPFLKKHGDPRSAGSGREALTRATLANYRGLLEVCPELKELHHRLQERRQHRPEHLLDQWSHSGQVPTERRA